MITADVDVRRAADQQISAASALVEAVRREAEFADGMRREVIASQPDGDWRRERGACWQCYDDALRALLADGESDAS